MNAEKKYIFGSKKSKWALYRFHLDGYMKRWIFKTPFERVPFIKTYIPLKNIRLHHILRSDLDTALHDHPFSFWTILLTGGYLEVLPLYDLENLNYDIHNQVKYLKRDHDHVKYIKRFCGSVRWVAAETAHRLILEKPVWTLVFAEEAQGRWGFYRGGFSRSNWIDHEKYLGINEEVE